MGIKLKKGQRVTMGLNKLGVGLGWDPNTSSGEDFDLDVSAFLIGSNGKCGKQSDFVFYQSELRTEPFSSKFASDDDWKAKTRPMSSDGAVLGSFDDTSGNESDGGDDETINIDLQKVSSDTQEIIIVVTIYDAESRGQNFGQVRNSYIRIYDENTGREELQYDLDEDYSTETSIEVARLYRRGSEWKFDAMGMSYNEEIDHFFYKYCDPSWLA
ncbi:TerD family protein [Aureibacter tunicatorum]|uniref:Tellurium resistance protein TerD n=2 Tax=Aureibacter tunicatorum TaxID=866807 RepID=A0AAE4BT42_9BACT|nr:TerD family protein [Aureibacter tunicatorum]MDR6240401.1 tellurium resistance protein TerD [Aureibacter tunicatorum]BDD05719.1 chemical-damaging agent resistance protein C [Aureibacter tunicatorum]